MKEKELERESGAKSILSLKKLRLLDLYIKKKVFWMNSEGFLSMRVIFIDIKTQKKLNKDKHLP